MDDYKSIYKDLPQLIVALDSLDDDANYIHIADVKEDTIYYCPCCKGVIKPRAYKDDKEYQVQPHFYHESGGCNEEAFVHYICKTWLFESGCQFKIEGELYTVDKIETEKTYHTQFGDYRPDITVYTKIGKVFFFEIKYSNKKTDNYIPKWDELDNDVVEVDTRDFINQKNVNGIPEFNLIYSDGKCFIKTYVKKDYEETIAEIKAYWKIKQNKIDYKILWQKLDWFWNNLCNYKNGELSEEDLFDSFRELQPYDMDMCWNLVFNKYSKLKSIKNDIRDIINENNKLYFDNVITDLQTKYSGFIEIYRYNWSVRSSLYMYFRFTDNYSVFADDKKSDEITIENRKTILLSSDIDNFLEKFKLKEKYIMKHIELYTEFLIKIQDDYLLRNQIEYINFDCSNVFSYYGIPLYFTKENNNEIDDIRKFCNECMAKKYSHTDIYFIYDIIKDYFTKINEECRSIFSFDYDYEDDSRTIKFYYNNSVVIKILIDKSYVEFKNQNKKYLYTSKDKESIKYTIIKALNEDVSNLKTTINTINFINDISNYNNETWKFNISKTEIIPKIEIIFNYLAPFYEGYSKRVYIKKIIDVPCFLLEEIKLIDYKKKASEFIDGNLAPVMKEMMDTEIANYNSSHLTSVLYKTSEVKTYDK